MTVSPPLPRPPHDPPTWLTLHRAVMMACVWLPATSGACALGSLLRGAADAMPGLVFSLSLFVAEYVVARAVLRAKDKVAVFGRALVGQVGACLVAAVAQAVMEQVVRDRHILFAPPDASRFVYPLAIAVATSVVGLLAGLWLGVFASFVLDQRQSPTNESVDRAVLAGCIMTGVPAVLALGWSRAEPLPEPVLFAVLGVGLPVAVMAWTGARLRARRRWLARVEAGDVPGWRVQQDPQTRVKLLVATAAPTVPFRGAETAQPVAFVAKR